MLPGGGAFSLPNTSIPDVLRDLRPGDRVVLKLERGGDVRGVYGGHDEVIVALDGGRQSVRIIEIAAIEIEAATNGVE